MTSTLDRLLATLDVRLHAFAVCEVRPGWRLVFEPMAAVVVHYVLAGAGELRVGQGAAPVGLAPHVMAIVPPGRGQSLTVPGGAPGSPARDAPAGSSCTMPADGLVKFDAGTGPAGLLVACGTITATHGGAFGLFDALPGALAEDLDAAEPLRHAFGLMLAELARPGVGTKALTEALMKQCLVLLLRLQLARGGEGSPLLAALPDPRLARAVALVLEAPAAAHTLQGLAAAAGMSRSSFAERFAAAFAQTPLDFVRRVRLREAARLLGATALPVKVIAASVGYASRSRFSGAFRDAYGLDPTAYRTSASGAGEVPFPAAVGPAPNRPPIPAAL